MPQLRAANPGDIPELQALITRSAIGLSQPFYSERQAQALLDHVFGVDSQLIADQTYYAIYDGLQLLACGGWSKRKTMFGGDQVKHGPDPLLDPTQDAARIRAFFVDPVAARRGLGSELMRHCTQQAATAGFHSLELVATLPGEPLYLAFGFSVVERFDLALPGGILVPVSKMHKPL